MCDLFLSFFPTLRGMQLTLFDRSRTDVSRHHCTCTVLIPFRKVLFGINQSCASRLCFSEAENKATTKLLFVSVLFAWNTDCDVLSG